MERGKDLSKVEKTRRLAGVVEEALDFRVLPKVLAFVHGTKTESKTKQNKIENMHNVWGSSCCFEFG